MQCTWKYTIFVLFYILVLGIMIGLFFSYILLFPLIKKIFMLSINVHIESISCFHSLCLTCKQIFLAEVSSFEWEFINMSEQEEDLIFRMYKLVGDR